MLCYDPPVIRIHQQKDTMKRLGLVLAVWSALTVAVAALVVGVAIDNAFGATSPPDIPITTVVRGAPGSIHLLETVPVDPGQECTVTASGKNGKSVHPNTDLLIRSGTDEVVVPDVEHTSDFTTTASGTLTTGSTVTVSVRLGADGVFSGGVTVSLDCKTTPPPTTTPPTTVVPPPPPVVTTTTTPATTTTTTAKPPVVVTTPPTQPGEPELAFTGGPKTGDYAVAGFFILGAGVAALGAVAYDRRRRAERRG